MRFSCVEEHAVFSFTFLLHRTIAENGKDMHSNSQFFRCEPHISINTAKTHKSERIPV